MMRMTSRERYLASLQGGSVDRFFRLEHGPWPSTFQRWVQEGLPAGADFFTYFEFDPLFRIPINSGYTDSPYYPVLQEEILEETADHVIFRDSQGITKKNLKKNFDTSMPQFLRFPVETRRDWDRMRGFLDPKDNWARIGNREPLLRRTADPSIPTLLPICGAFGHPRNLFGDEGLSYMIYDDPELLHDILDNWCALYVDLLRTLTAFLRVDSLLIWEDMCYKCGPLLSPAHFRTFMLPRYLEVIRTARECGVSAVIVDSDGDVRDMLELFIEGGADAVFPFEVQAGMDVVEIRRRFGERFCLIGGIDKRALAKDPSAIRAEVDRVLPFFVGQGRFIPTLDHTVPVDVSLSNFRFYLDCVRHYEKM